MDEFENIQLPEIFNCEDARSERICVETNIDAVNILEVPLKDESSISSINDKTDEEKTIQNTDNSISTGINSPKTIVLGKLKAKQRLQAFLLPKQNVTLNSPIKKDDIQVSLKTEKATRKIKKNPIDKAKSIIEELEEIKKVEIAKLASPILFKERRSSYREKHYRRKSRSKSVECARKLHDKDKYPGNWQEVNHRQLSLEDIRDIKQSRVSRNTKCQETCYDFRKQLLFESPSKPLVPLKIKGINGQDKTVPSQYIRFTKKSPSISYSISHHKYYEEYLCKSEIYGYIPKSHEDILSKFKTAACEKFTEDSLKKPTRKWYPKQPMSSIIEGCELLEKSLGLSILQSYMDEEEEEEKNDLSCYDISKPSQNVNYQSVKVQSPFENELSSNGQLIDFTTAMPSKDDDKILMKEEMNTVKDEDAKLQIETSRKTNKFSDGKNNKPKRKKENKDLKETRKRKRKKDKEKIKTRSAKKVKNSKSEKGESDSKKISKSRKKENIPDKRLDVDKTKNYKEKKKEMTEGVDIVDFNKVKTGEKRNKTDKKENKNGSKNEDRKETKRSDQKESKFDRKQDKKGRNIKNRLPTVPVPLYYDELESARGRSSSRERSINCKIKPQQEESARECKKKEYLDKDDLKKQKKNRTDEESRNKVNNSTKTQELNKSSQNNLQTDTKSKLHNTAQNQKTQKKGEGLLNIEQLQPEEDFGTPDTDEYHSHWESDEDVTNVISYSPLLPRKPNSSWESDEDVGPDKITIENRHSDEFFKNLERSTDRRSRRYLQGERSLEMPLNILNLSRKEMKRSKSPNISDRKLLNNDRRLIYDQDSWERSDFLKIYNDIEGEKLRHERKTLSEERRLLELEKRKLAEKLEKRSFNSDIFDNQRDNVKESTFTNIYSETVNREYIYDNKLTNCKDVDYDAKTKSEHETRKRAHSIEDQRKLNEIDDVTLKENQPKKFICEEIENRDINCKENKDNFSKFENNDGEHKYNEKKGAFLQDSQEKCSKRKRDKWKNENASGKYLDKINDLNQSHFMSGISDSLNSTCDSLLCDTMKSNKSDILENQYEEFLKAVTSDMSKSENVYNDKRLTRRKREIKSTKSKRKRKYSTSSSSSSSDSYDTDSSTSNSSSSSYSSSSSTSSCEMTKKRRTIKTKGNDQRDKENLIKIEMTHSIVKDLDDLQPFPISKGPVIHIKKEQEDFGYPEVLSNNSTELKDTEDIVPLPVPSPAIVPPPFVSLLSIKQESSEYSITSKADSTTSPVKKIPLIPTKFIAPLPRKEVSVIAVTNSSIILNTIQKNETAPVKSVERDFVESSIFSIPNKHAVFSESINDCDSLDFTDYFPKEPISSARIHEKVTNINISDRKSLAVLEPTKDTELDKTLTKTEESLTKIEEIHDSITVELISTVTQECKDTEVKLLQQRSSSIKANLSPKQTYESPKRRSISKDSDKTLHSEISRHNRRSTSPKYRALSPRRASSPRKFRDPSPSYRTSSRYRGDSSGKRTSPRRKRSLERYDKRKMSPLPKSRRSQSFRSRTSLSPRRRKSLSPKGRRISPFRIRRSPSPRIRRSPSPRLRRSPSPRIRRASPRKSSMRTRRSSSPRLRRSISPTTQRLVSPRNRRSPFRSRSSNRKISPTGRTYNHCYNRSPSPTFKKESIQQTLQRLAGIEDHYHQAMNKSPINSPVDGFKRSVADSTISDDQLLQQNSAESVDSPIYRTSSTRLIQSPLSPKRVPLDVRINQVLGLDKDIPNPLAPSYTQTTYTENYSYNEYPEQYEVQYNQYNQSIIHKDNYIQPPAQPILQSTVRSSKVVQIGNMLQVVPTEDISLEEHTKQIPSQKIVQVGNMLQIVPTPNALIINEAVAPPLVSELQAPETDASLEVLQSTLITNELCSPVHHNIPTTSNYEKISPEEIMLQKISERRAERAKRHEERERKRKEKEKRRKEKEKKKQLKLKIKTENTIKKALRIETEALAMGETIDEDENATDTIPGCWPSTSSLPNPCLKSVGKGILITHGFSKVNIEDEHEQKKLKCVKFADGVAPGEGTSPSGGEELSSPPPPKEKRNKKIKKKKLQKKKKIKVKIIRKTSTDSPDDDELDNLPPPSPPPGSPPSNIFPARIKTHTINSIHPTYATSVPVMPVGNYVPQFRPTIAMTVPPPIHNLPHSTHHGPSTPRTLPQMVAQHGLPLHSPIPHAGVSAELPLGMCIPGPQHHSSG